MTRESYLDAILNYVGPAQWNCDSERVSGYMSSFSLPLRR